MLCGNGGLWRLNKANILDKLYKANITRKIIKKKLQETEHLCVVVAVPFKRDVFEVKLLIFLNGIILLDEFEEIIVYQLHST